MSVVRSIGSHILSEFGLKDEKAQALGLSRSTGEVCVLIEADARTGGGGQTSRMTMRME